jgi:hypothetical protein
MNCIYPPMRVREQLAKRLSALAMPEKGFTGEPLHNLMCHRHVLWVKYMGNGKARWNVVEVPRGFWKQRFGKKGKK